VQRTRTSGHPRHAGLALPEPLTERQIVVVRRPVLVVDVVIERRVDRVRITVTLARSSISLNVTSSLGIRSQTPSTTISAKSAAERARAASFASIRARSILSAHPRTI
jgi:hypothetical protein